MTTPTDQVSPLVGLYEHGERFGWTFRDRNLFRTRYAPPYPTPQPIPQNLVDSANRAKQKMAGRMMISVGAGVGLALLIGCCGIVISATSHSSNPYASTSGNTESFVILAVLAVLAVLAGIVGLVFVAVHASSAKSALVKAQQQQVAQHQQACLTYEYARRQHDLAEQQRVDRFDEWGGADPSAGTRRIDIVGGNVWGWEALLTVFGASLLRTRGPLTLVDFTGEAACRELIRLAAANEISTDVRLLPAQLAETNLLGGLRPRQVVDALIEAMHGDNTAGSRVERSQDDRILMAVCGVLGEDITMARVAAALRVLMGEPGKHDQLTLDERQRISEDLFADEFKRQVHPDLRRIEAFVYPMEEMGTSAVETQRDAMLTCLVDEIDGRNVRRELLKDLIIQWLIQRVSAQNLATRSLVIAGADEISHLHLERLTDLCERRDIRLVLLFRHLRDGAVTALGGGTVGFMRLANHEEARQAADFIGHQHTFVLSQLTRTLGGNDTHSTAETDTHQNSKGGGWSPGGHHTNWGISRSWAQTVTVAEGTNWSDAASAQRVYEYAVEPRTLQDLPDYALLLLKGHGSTATLQPVECNPAIVTLPRVAMQPLPEMALPDPAIAWIPTAGSPTHLTIGQQLQPGTVNQTPGQAATGALPGWGQPTAQGQPAAQGQIGAGPNSISS